MQLVLHNGLWSGLKSLPEADSESFWGRIPCLEGTMLSEVLPNQVWSENQGIRPVQASYTLPKTRVDANPYVQNMFHFIRESYSLFLTSIMLMNKHQIQQWNPKFGINMLSHKAARLVKRMWNWKACRSCLCRGSVLTKCRRHPWMVQSCQRRVGPHKL